MRRVFALLVTALAAVFIFAYRRVLWVTQRPSWPPPDDAVTAAGARAATAAFAARGGTRPHHAALPFAWSTAATIEPWAEGVNFFPRIFADVEAAQLSSFFPEPADPGSTPIALAQVIPGGHVAASQAIAEQIDDARERLDLMNPYVTDRGMIDRIVAAARRGVQVRLVVSKTSNNGQATSALKHRYPDLIEAGVAVWELPDTVVHAKVVVADDVVSFGTVNLDAWALYRNSEIMMIAKSPEAAVLIEERLFEPDIARASPGLPPATPEERRKSWLWNKLSHLL
jgi:phosphatidylserine/phosphatidylglycerophosphate/cardiolipin synthase-like enzyme